MAGSSIPDQNIVQYKFDSGLWNVDLFNSNPPNYSFVEQLDNLYVKADGSLATRPGMTSVTSFTTPAVRSTPLRYVTGVFSNSAPYKTLVYDPEYNFSSTPKRCFCISQLGSGNANGFANFGNVELTAFVEYTNVIYFSTTSGVSKITSVAWPNPTISAIASSPGLDGMIFFKGRLFGFKNSTIYFTEVTTTAVPNPETWNTATNNITVNATGATPKIYKMMVFNDRILIFTDQGIFGLSIQGTPSSWLLKPLDLAVAVNSFDCAFEYRGSIYFISNTGVGVTNGSATQFLSDPIRGQFIYSTAVNSSYRIFKIGDHLVISLSANSTLGGGFNYRCFYTSFENLGSWAKYGSVGTNGIPVASIPGSPVGSNSVVSDGVIFSKTTSTTFANLLTWESGNVADAGSTNTYTLVTTSLPFGNLLEDKYIKYGFLVFREIPAGGTLQISVSVDGIVSSIITAFNLNLGTHTGKKVFKFTVGTRVRIGKVTIQYQNATSPYFILESVNFVVGTERLVTESSEV